MSLGSYFTHDWCPVMLQVKFAQQQTVRKMVKKSYRAPTDPDWPKQWYLVSPSALSSSHCYIIDITNTSVLQVNLKF